MLYLAQSQVHQPPSMPQEEWDRLAQAESDYGIQARRNGHLVDIWRVVGEYAAVSIWNAADHDEMHRVLSGLPLFAHADFTITALATHPSTIRWNGILAEEQS